MGGVNQILSSGNFHESAKGWKRFQDAIRKEPLVLNPTPNNPSICAYGRSGSEGLLDVILNKRVAAK